MPTISFEDAMNEPIPQVGVGIPPVTAQQVPTPGNQTVDPFEAAVRGFSNAATFGLAPRISAGVNSLIGNGSYNDLLTEYLARDKAAAQQYPKTTLATSLPPQLLQAVATGGGSIPRQLAVNAAMGAANAAGNAPANQSAIDTAQAALRGGVTQAALAGAIPAVAVGAGKLAQRNALNTANQGIQQAEQILRTRAPGYKDQALKMVGSSAQEATQQGQTPREIINAVKEELNNPGLGITPAQSLSDMSSAVRPLVQAQTPTWGQIAKDTWDTVKQGAVSAGGGALMNAASGSPVNPVTAALAGGAFGAGKAALNVAKEVGTNLGNKYAMTGAPEAVSQFFTHPATQAAGTMIGQQTTPYVNQVTGTPSSPFSNLINFINQSSSDNPAVQAMAQQASNIDPTDDEAVRKVGMQLSASPAGRAVTNSDSPENQ